MNSKLIAVPLVVPTLMVSGELTVVNLVAVAEVPVPTAVFQ